MKPDPNTPKHLVVKALSWEILNNFVYFSVACLMFGNIGGCVLFIAICFIVKLILWLNRWYFFD